MSERTIPDVWEVFGSQKILARRNSWQKMQMMSEEEKTVTDLFSDLHIHAACRSYTPASADSAVDLDLSDDDEPVSNSRIDRKSQHNNSSKRRGDQKNDKNDKQRGSSNCVNEWEHIEKHLSMKKTIRKKMMRDLQQAFIDGEHDPHHWTNVQMASNNKHGEPNLLDMLKDNGQVQPSVKNGSPFQSNCIVDPKSNANEPTTPTKKPGFWKKFTMRRSKR